ncbi:MAG: fumarylacetoacetase [Bacteroidetes bacterium]|nr:fumarylacetoacetase [Bacteroidota bacterium]
MDSWIDTTLTPDFSIHNLPFGIFSTIGSLPRPGVAIGDKIVDLQALHKTGCLHHLQIPAETLDQRVLNPLISLGKSTTNQLRLQLQHWLSAHHDNPLRHNAHVLVNRRDAAMHLPVAVGDYTDFYASMDHATNVGKMFRDPDNALLPNWKHLPVGYHGRASSIVVSGTSIHRPYGQVKPPTASAPVFKPSARLDFELEVAMVLGKENPLGQPIDIQHSEDYIFGYVLFNDWSARDIQAWEYVPLGPFLGKNFGSSVSPWIVTTEALSKFKVNGQVQDPPVLPYLKENGNTHYDIELSVYIKPDGGREAQVCRTNLSYMYWSPGQMLAHHTSNGCNLRVGDLLASGTISGPEPHQFGSMLELSWSGSRPIDLGQGIHRHFLEDHDTVTMRGHAVQGTVSLGFGEVTGQILPSLPWRG